MSVIALPTSANLVKFEIIPHDNSQKNTSEWTGKSKTTQVPGNQYWTAQFAPHEIIETAHKKQWRGFLIQMLTRDNVFYLPVAENQRSGTNPTVRTGANSGKTIPLQGLPASQTVLDIGDWITVPLPSGHNRLAMLDQPLVSNAAGQATASFWPYLDETPTTGATVETINPFIPMKLPDEVGGFKDDYGMMLIQFEAMEAL